MNDTFELTVNQFFTSANPFTLFRTQETTTNRGIEVELKLEWDKISHIFNELVTDLEKYENQFGMDSEDFYQDFQSGEISEEREEFYDWRVKYSSYRSMNERFGLTR